MKKENQNLEFVAARLEGLEETIISRLIDRAQFHVNSSVYLAGKSGFSGEPSRSLFEIRMQYQENMDALFGRFCVPEERPFTRNLPSPRRAVILEETGLNILNFDKVNLSSEILTDYFDLITKLCQPSDDGQYGLSVEHDIYALQAIARRIHYGAMYIAECKYSSSTDLLNQLIENNDYNGMMSALTRKDVEDRIITRIREKTIAAQVSINELVRYRIDPEIVVKFYRDTIIPLTKKGEIAYLLNRRRN